VIENMVLRVIFGTECADIKGGWRKAPNEGLHDLYFHPTFFW
jgi:hypothetical protein